MKTKDLIKQLQAMVDAHEPEVEVFGEHEIVIDVWQAVDDAHDHMCWQYKGFSGNITITHSADGVYPIISATESWT